MECAPSAVSGGKYLMYWVAVSGQDANNNVRFMQLTRFYEITPPCRHYHRYYPDENPSEVTHEEQQHS